MDDFNYQLSFFLSLPDEELSRPLWEIPWEQRKAFLSARTRRQFAGKPIEEGFTPEAHERVTDFAETY